MTTTESKLTSFWTERSCTEDALQYESKSDWMSSGTGSYEAAKNNLWVRRIRSAMIAKSKSKANKGNILWTLSNTYMEASKYPTKIAWFKGSNKSYQAASRRKWHKYMAHLFACGRTKWNLENCLAESKKYKSIGCWALHSPGSYQAVLRNGWKNHLDSRFNINNIFDSKRYAF